MKSVMRSAVLYMLVLALVSETSCKKEKEELIGIATITSKSDLVKISLKAVYNKIEIDWGDGSTKEDLEDDPNKLKKYSHTYSNTNEHTITISGKFLYFACDDNQLTSLNISELFALAISCSNNQLTSLDVSAVIGLEQLTCAGNLLSADALNTLFSTLPVLKQPSGSWIDIKDNPGTYDCDRSIATKKGWIVFDE